MPFLNPDHKPMIKHPQGHPVAVIAVFNTVGDLIPRYYCIEDDNCELFKYKIHAIKARKDNYMVETFYCSFIAYDFINDIVLCYDVAKHRWTVG